MSSHRFEDLCLPLRDTLRARAVQLARDPHAAQDLVQDALLRAYETWETFHVPEGEDPVDRARAWLARILKNCFIDSFRARTRQAAAREERADEIAAMTMAEAGPAADAGLIEAEGPGDDRIRGALGALCPMYREVIVRTARGESDLDIAGALDIDRRNVRKRLFRARRRLAELLDTPERDRTFTLRPVEFAA